MIKLKKCQTKTRDCKQFKKTKLKQTFANKKCDKKLQKLVEKGSEKKTLATKMRK